jgi:hypothetical protein
LSAYHPTVETVGFPGLHFVKIPKAKRLPYISLNGDLAKLRIERKIVPFSLFLKLNKKCKRKSPNQKGRGFIVI